MLFRGGLVLQQVWVMRMSIVRSAPDRQKRCNQYILCQRAKSQDIKALSNERAGRVTTLGVFIFHMPTQPTDKVGLKNNGIRRRNQFWKDFLVDSRGLCTGEVGSAVLGIFGCQHLQPPSRFHHLPLSALGLVSLLFRLGHIFVLDVLPLPL